MKMMKLVTIAAMAMTIVGSVMADTYQVYECKMNVKEPVYLTGMCGQSSVSYKDMDYKGFLCIAEDACGNLNDTNCTFYIYRKCGSGYIEKCLAVDFTVFGVNDNQKDTSCYLDCSDGVNDFSVCGIGKACSDSAFKSCDCNVSGVCSDQVNLYNGNCKFRYNKVLSKKADAIGFWSAIYSKLPDALK